MDRIPKLQAKISKEHLSAIIISKPENVRYLCGFTGTNGRLLVTPRKATLITDFRYLRSARKQMPRGVAIFDQKDGQSKILGRFKTLGIEDRDISYARYLYYKKKLKGVKLKGISGMVEEMRIVKDAYEMRIIRKAVRIANAAFEKLVKTIRPGVSEDELEWNLFKFARQLGADGFSFPPIIAFGKNTADVHHQKEPNKLKKGESVLIDMGIVYKGYMTDMTRMLFTVGPGQKTCPERMRRIYTTVLEANLAAISGIKVGMMVSQVDKIARDIIKKAGYGKQFGHSTGHGVGLEVHEAPKVGEKDETILKPGMVFTIEPGIYLNSIGGVRIEDMVFINKSGKVDILTTPSKDLTILKI